MCLVCFVAHSHHRTFPDDLEDMLAVDEGAQPFDATKPDEAEAEEAKRKEDAEQASLQKASDVVIKPGDYQVHVHVLMAKDLKGEDANGLSDPIVEVTAFGETQHTKIHYDTNTCVFDETFVFMQYGLREPEVEQVRVSVVSLSPSPFHSPSLSSTPFPLPVAASSPCRVFSASTPVQGTIKFDVFDANKITRNTLIGTFQMDVARVYFNTDHEFYRQWVALVDSRDEDDQGIQGYLRVSVAVVGPGDKLKIHNDKMESAAGGIAKATTDDPASASVRPLPVMCPCV